MAGSEKIKLDRNQLNKIKIEIIEELEKYIDDKLRPVINYFRKKKDYYEMTFL